MSSPADSPDSSDSSSAAASPPVVELYTDGACSGNPGPGGWAYILRHQATGKEKEDSGGEAETTNNRMELMAVIQGLAALKRACQVKLFADSVYVGKGLTEWLPGWKRRGWRRGDKPIKNLELWKKLDQLAVLHQLTFIHVRGHSGHPENERCDELAVAASKRFR